MKLLWIFTALSSALGAFMFLLSSGMNGIGQASGFAAASALAVVPYVFTRCVQAMVENGADENARKIADAIATMNQKQ